jgi:catechol 2,3-dioxygenase-like lactoylglutathione lyase family enzyme
MRLILLTLLLFAHALAADPVPESERIPVDFRRTTLLVHDIDASLPLYRDGLGLKVIYDQMIGAGTDKKGRPTPPTIRLVLLRANDTFIGNLGLMQRLNERAPRKKKNAKARAGQSILVFNVKDLEQRFTIIEKLRGIEIATRPERVEYPAPDGGVIPVLFSAVYDADGFYIEINKLLGAPAGAAKH